MAIRLAMATLAMSVLVPFAVTISNNVADAAPGDEGMTKPGDETGEGGGGGSCEQAGSVICSSDTASGKPGGGYWKWYAFAPGQTTVEVGGHGSVKGGSLTNCPAGVSGYYRRALVAHTAGTDSLGNAFSVGDQVGLWPNPLQMKYRAGGVSAAEAEAAYEEAYSRGAVSDGWGTVSMFCYDPTWDGGGTAVVTPPPPAANCPTSSVDSGTTTGKTLVSKGGAWSAGTIWARPGDSIRFYHELCPGAQAVRHTGSPNHKHDTDPRAQEPSYTDTRPTVTAGRDDCTITASPSSHLFRNTSANCGGKLGNRDVRPFYSPTGVGNFYQCMMAGSNVVRNDSYQLPGFASKPVECRNTIRASELGQTISQGMSFGPVSARSSQVNEAWTDWYVIPGNQHEAMGDFTTNWRLCNSEGTYIEDVGPAGCGHQHDASTCPSLAIAKETLCAKIIMVGPSEQEVSKQETHTYWSGSARDTGKTSASVKIPYNYDTAAVAETNAGVLTAGGEFGVVGRVELLPRSNAGVGSSYATMSKSSVWEVVAFTVGPTSASTVVRRGGKVGGAAGSAMCGYYDVSGDVTSCRSLLRESGRLNGDGDLRGTAGKAASVVWDEEIVVPDALPGTKLCVAVGVFPADSHNGAGSGGDNELGMLDGNGSVWNYSVPVCRAIGKRPTVQFLGGGVFTTGGVVTGQTKKQVGKMVDGRLPGSGSLLSGSAAQGGGQRRVFGSFGQYEVVAGGEVVTGGGVGFASGAAFGWERNNSTGENGGVKFSVDTNSVGVSGGYPGVSLNVGEPKVCSYSGETLANEGCEAGRLGGLAMESLDKSIVGRLVARYTSDGDEGTVLAAGANVTAGMLTGAGRLDVGSVGAGARYVRVDGNASLAGLCLGMGAAGNNQTVVLDVRGTLTVNGNVAYGNPGVVGCPEQEYGSLAELPQFLVFAADVRVASGVNRIDAWLVVGQRSVDRGTGELNTCVIANVNSLSTAVGAVCRQRLVVNGPVWARRLVLNRTAGAGHDPLSPDSWSPVANSVQAAEIFNLRADAYLWGFDQAQRFSQAVTVYQREMSVRY